MPLDDNGHEVPDRTPRSIPVRFKRQTSLIEDVQRFVREELSRQADAQGVESFDEADDFDVGEDYEPRSPYELDEENERYDVRDEIRSRREEEASRKRVREAESRIRGEGKGNEESAEGPLDSERQSSEDGPVKSPLKKRRQPQSP